MLVVATGKPITSVGSRANLVTGEYKKLSKCRGQKNCTHEARKGNDVFIVLFQDINYIKTIWTLLESLIKT